MIFDSVPDYTWRILVQSFFYICSEEPDNDNQTNNMTTFKWLVDHINYNKDECLNWPFSHRPDGYGQVGIPGGRNSENVHRVMCRLVHGPAPINKQLALHKCNNKICVNPKHLYWGSPSDNTIDARNIGKGPNQKLNLEDVKYIRKSKKGVQTLAKQFNVSIGTIYKILRNDTWENIK